MALDAPPLLVSVFPEYFIIRVNEFNDVARTPIEEWLDYLKNNHISDNTTAPGLREARERLLYMTMSDADRHAYDAHLDAIMVQNDTLDTYYDDGFADGKKAEAIAIALKMKSMGIGVDVIEQATGLSADEINKL